MSVQPVKKARRLPSLRLASVFAAGGLLVAASVGAGAAGVSNNNPASGVLQVLGISHGESVHESVHEAIENTPPTERGGAVSEAACRAAHDRSTLPDGAQAAPGQVDREPKDCSDLGADAEDDPGDQNEPKDSIQSTPPGPERGTAAREAACQAKQERVASLPAEEAQAATTGACSAGGPDNLGHRGLPENLFVNPGSITPVPQKGGPDVPPAGGGKPEGLPGR